MKAPELPALTGIRFLAATCVFLFHACSWPGMVWMPPVDLAKFGVALFFVLSGFILTYNYAGLFADGVNFRNYGKFIWDRLAKVYPLYLLTLLVSIPFELLGHHRVWSWSAMVSQLALLQCILPIDHLSATDHFNVPGWSISCEFFFYLLAPILIWFGLTARRPFYTVVLAVVVAFAVVAGAGMWAVHMTSWYGRFAPARLPEFIIGIAAAVCFLKGGVPGRRGVSLAVSGGLVLLVLSLWANERVPAYLSLGFLCAPGGALLIYGLAYGQGWMAWFFSQRLVTLLGMSSFAFYLVHDLFIRAGKGIFYYCHITLANPWAITALALALFLVVQITSIFLFKKFEVPVQKFLRGLAKRKKSNDNIPPKLEQAASNV